MAEIEKLDGKSMNIVEQNIEQLKALFPSVFSEGKIQFNQLEELLGNYVVEDEDHYNFTWHGKRKAGRLAQTPSTGTLRPCKEESVDWDNTENLFIEGDNLEVLKLLQKSYHRQVKMIYIDPPYNTGNDFVYEDDFKDGIKNYLEMTGQLDGEGKKNSSSSNSSGRYHTNWLNMMYPRLKLARNLMCDDGLIFISIDDNEEANLICLCREIFGEENYLANIAWKHTQQSKNDEPYFSRNKNSIIVFRKSDSTDKLRAPRTAQDNKNYSNPDNDPNGMWRSGDVRSPSLRNTLKFDVITPSGKTIAPPEKGWRWMKASVDEKISSGEIIFSPDETKIIRKIYLKNQDGRTPENVWLGEKYGTTRKANTQIKNIFDDKVPFDTPKPIELIQNAIKLIRDDKDFIVLDFFAGSATSAESLMQANVEDNGNRKFIMVQLPEKLDLNKKEQKVAAEFCISLSAPTNIAELSKERIRRAGKRIKENNPGLEDDIGFRVFKLDSSNIKRWDADFDTLEADLVDAVDYLVEGRSDEDVLYELCLKLGLDLSVKIEEKTVAGEKLFVLGRGYLVVCLSDNITMDLVNCIGALKDELASEDGMRVVFKDDGFKDDVIKTNALQTLKRFGIDDIKSL